MKPFPYCDDDSMPSDYPFLSYYTSIHNGLKKNLGMDLGASRNEAGNIPAYGFVNEHHEIVKVPIGDWPESKLLKTGGMYGKVGVVEGLQAMADGALRRGLGWNKEQVEIMLLDVKQCLSEGNDVRAYLSFHGFYAQEPPADYNAML